MNSYDFVIWKTVKPKTAGALISYHRPGEKKKAGL